MLTLGLRADFREGSGERYHLLMNKDSGEFYFTIVGLVDGVNYTQYDFEPLSREDVKDLVALLERQLWRNEEEVDRDG